MRRDQLEHAIRAVCQIIQSPDVIVVGSQAILGTYDESQLPAEATMSLEVDILPIADSNDETARLADVIEGVAGEFSPSSSSTASASWCLDKEDLCVAKLVALREKDRNFVAALVKAGLVDADLIASRLSTIPSQHRVAADRALAWQSPG